MTQERNLWDSIPLLFEKIAVKVDCRKGIWLSFKDIDLHNKIPLKNTTTRPIVILTRLVRTADRRLDYELLLFTTVAHNTHFFLC